MKTVENSVDPLNLVHKGGSIGSNIFTPWKGGSSGTPDSTVPLPTAPDAVAPVAMTDQSVLAAQDDYSRSNMLKKSVAKTIYAGDTGGFMAGKPTASRPGI